eukprot:scaffold121752_cov29-Tisochrysis_lutea.AAC.14
MSPDLRAARRGCPGERKRARVTTAASHSAGPRWKLLCQARMSGRPLRVQTKKDRLWGEYVAQTMKSSSNSGRQRFRSQHYSQHPRLPRLFRRLPPRAGPLADSNWAGRPLCCRY